MKRQVGASGWPPQIARLQKEMYLIFAISSVAVTILLLFYFSNVVGFVVPIVCAVWGMGIGGLFKTKYDTGT